MRIFHDPGSHDFRDKIGHKAEIFIHAIVLSHYFHIQEKNHEAGEHHLRWCCQFSDFLLTSRTCAIFTSVF